MGMASGREIWGFPKGMATITIPSQTSDSAKFIANTMVFKTFDKECEAQNIDLITISKVGSLGLLKSTFLTAIGLFKFFIGMFNKNWFKDIELFIEIVKLAKDGLIPTINLKQFRDVEDTTKACYQAIEKANMIPVKLNGIGSLEGYTLKIEECMSHQIIQDLGLKGSVVPAKFGIWAKFDKMLIQGGKTIWRANTNS